MNAPRTAVQAFGLTSSSGNAGTVQQPKVAVVTGASGNIGHAICKRLLDDEWCVLAVTRTLETAHALNYELSKTYKKIISDTWAVMDADLSFTDDYTYLRDLRQDKPTALICAHGIASKHPSGDLPLADFRHMLEVNLTSCLALAKAYYPHMQAAGFGRIVFIGSIHGQQTYPQRAAYAASKAGLEALARVLALEWAADGVTTNVIAPGHLDVPMHGSPTDDAFLEGVRRRTPTGRLATAEQIASLTAWLLSDDAAQVNGQTLRVDGGLGVSAWPGEYGGT